MKTFRSPRDLVAAVEQALDAKPASSTHRTPLDEVVGLLHRGRHYLWTSIYLCADQVRLVRVASAGPETQCLAVEPGEGNVGRAAQTGIVRVVPDVKADPQYIMSLAATRSELVVPIKIGGQGAISGAHADYGWQMMAGATLAIEQIRNTALLTMWDMIKTAKKMNREFP